MGATDERDPYVILGVSRHASAAEIRAAYRALVAKYHPDRHQGNPLEKLASEKMAEINRAYETLSDPAHRRAHDAGAPVGGHGGGGGGGEGAPWAAGGTPDFGAASSSSRRGMKIVAVLSLLPVLLRFGGLIVRGLVAVARELMEGLAVLRGTPFVAAAVLLAIVVLVVALLRRRRLNKRATRP
jgi:hypothetical protein